MAHNLILFYAFAAIAVVSTLLVIAQPNPMYSVLLLIASFMALAGLYVLLDAPFVAVTQIIVYAGAIMVLFLFVVMLLNVPREEARQPENAAVGRIRRCAAFGTLLAIIDGVRAGVGVERPRAEQRFGRRDAQRGRSATSGEICSGSMRSRSKPRPF